MRKLFTMMQNAPKRTSAVFMMIAAATIIPAALLAWGPGRETFTTAKPADYVTFNSITDNPVYGDERNFVTVKDAANTQDGGWKDTVNVAPGKKYLVRMYVHNNAAENLNLKSINTRVKASVPTTTAKSVPLSGFVTSDNAKPGEIWDDVEFTSGQDFNLKYVAGSARIYNNGYAKGGNGQSLPDSIVTSTGAKIGFNGPDGVVPGCFKYDNYVYFEVEPQFAAKPDFSVVKDVRKDGTTTYGQTSAVEAGDKVNYRITFKNTGEVLLKDVVLKDTLPTGVTYVPGTAKLQNSNYQYPNMYSMPETMFSTGANIGDYEKGGNAFITFTAQVAAKDKLPCGPQSLKNIASVTTDYGTKQDDAVITVNGKDCPPPKKIKVCELATKKVIEINESDFDSSKHSKNLDDCKEVVKKIKVCELATKKIITINESDFDSTKHSKNLKDCDEIVKKIKVCELATKAIITIDEKDFDSSKHSMNLDDCKPTEPNKIQVCELSTKKVITINEADFDSSKHSKNLDDCKVTPPVTPPTTPETPKELPTTGPAEAALSIVGLGSLIASIGYYTASRRALLGR